MNQTSLCLSILLLALFIGRISVAEEPEEILWSIGTSDDSGSEFAPGERWFWPAHPKDVVFRVGVSDARQDWPDFHPSTHQPTGGAREHAFKILFELKGPVVGSHALRIRTFINRPYYPDLEIAVNGHRGVFTLDPEPIPLSSAYWQVAANNLVLATAELDVDIPSSYLRRGENTLSLKAIRGTHLHYDAVSFVRREKRATSPISQIALRPTMLFRKSGGRLVELLELKVQVDAIREKIPFKFEMGSFRTSGFLPAVNRAFGEIVETIEVPADTPAGEARVTFGSPSSYAELKIPVELSRQWSLYSAPTIHDDVGYRETQPRTRATMEKIVDDVMTLRERYPWYRFHLESAWTASEYLAHHSAETRARFEKEVREKKIGVNGIYANMETSAMATEELARAFYLSAALHRRVGLAFETAVQGDQPTSTGALPTFLAEAGIKYFVESSNQARSPLFRNAALSGEVPLNMRSPYYWQGPDGSKVLMWSGIIYAQLARLVFGHPRHDFEFAVLSRASSENLDILRKSLPLFLKHYEAYDYPLDSVLLYGVLGDDHNFGDGEAPIIEKWNETFAFPKLRMCHISEFFEYVLANYPGEIPVIRGDMGAYWGDGYASAPLEIAWAREAQSLLPTAEKFGTLTALHDGRLEFSLEQSRDAWTQLLRLDEHTWGDEFTVRWPHSERQTQQQAWKRDFARSAMQQSRWLLQHGLEQLRTVQDIPYETIAVFNPVSWTRSGPVEAEMPAGDILIDPISGEKIPHAVLSDENGNHRVRFWAEDVPAVGYRVFQIRPDKHGGPKYRKGEKSTTHDGKHFSLRINAKTGGIASLFDKRLQRELVDGESPYGFNEYIYVTGGDGSSIASQFQPEEILGVARPRAESIHRIAEPWGARFVVNMTIPRAKIRSEISVYDTEPRVEIKNDLEKEPVYDHKESTYFAFPFLANNPKVSYRHATGWFQPNVDQVPGAAKEWFVIQEAVHLRNESKSIVWATRDAPVVTLQDIVRGRWPTHLKLQNGHVFSWVTNNYWFTNWPPAQGGSYTFRYGLTSGEGFDNTSATRFGKEIREPLISLVSRAQIEPPFGSRGSVPTPRRSFVNLTPDNVLLLTLKPADFGEGTIARLQEIGGKNTIARLRVDGLNLARAMLCSLVEEDRHLLKSVDGFVEVPLKGNGLATVRLVPK